MFLNNARKEKTLINVLRQTGSKESESSLQRINRISYHLVDKIFSIQQRVMSGTAKLSLSFSKQCFEYLSTSQTCPPITFSHKSRDFAGTVRCLATSRIGALQHVTQLIVPGYLKRGGKGLAPTVL